MSWVSFLSLRQLLSTSSFRQASTIAFICLLVSLASIVFSNHLLEVIMRGHVRDMILKDIRSHQVRQDLMSSTSLLSALEAAYVPELNHDQYLVLTDASGQQRYGAPSLRALSLCEPKCQWQEDEVILPQGHVLQLLGMTVRLPDGGRYYTAFDIRPMLERTRIISLMTGAGLLLILLFILVISLPFGVRNLYRINRIHEALRQFTGGDHQVRVPENPMGDEFDRLGCEVNQSLKRINRLMEEVRHVSNHIAHELRTPLTRLHGQLERAVEHSIDMQQDDAMRQPLLDAVTETERIQHLFRAVMRIAEVESGRCAHQFESFNARQLLDDVAEYYEPLAQARGCQLKIQAHADLYLVGDPALLFQAVANLIDNALKYAPKNEPLLLFAELSGPWAALGVADRGPGIPSHQMAHAAERFRRFHSPRDIRGSGLGLTLVQAIAELHGGTLQLSNNRSLSSGLKVSSCPPGLRATLVLRTPATPRVAS